MRKFRRWLYRRRVRKLAERILAGQPAFDSITPQIAACRNAIHTAELLYLELKWNWKERENQSEDEN